MCGDVILFGTSYAILPVHTPHTIHHTQVGALYDICEQPEDAAQAYARARDLGLKDAFFHPQ
ncbi:hypothetical protein EON63_25250, partial [archaeon]